MSTRSTPVPNHTALWPPLENSAAPAVTASAMVAPTLKAEPASRIGGRGVGANPARRGGGTGGFDPTPRLPLQLVGLSFKVSTTVAVAVTAGAAVVSDGCHRAVWFGPGGRPCAHAASVGGFGG